MASYKDAKEAFVADTTGSTILHVNLISSIALASLILYYTIETFPYAHVPLQSLSSPSPSPSHKSLVKHISTLSKDYVLLVLPLILCMTLFALPASSNSDAAPPALALIVACLIPAGMVGLWGRVRKRREALLPVPSLGLGSQPTSPVVSFKTARVQSIDSTFHLPSKLDSQALSSTLSFSTATPKPSTHHKRGGGDIPLEAVPYITIYRAHMMLMTLLAILAVDFPVFPRALAKCESFGVSLMDLGVGSFVFSQGIVSAIPLLKNPSYLIDTPLRQKLVDSTRKVLPVFVLGAVRVVLVKGTEYPEHVSEYGVHWNFFITMAILAPLGVLLHPLIFRRYPIALIGLGITFVHQALLVYTPLQSWVLHGTRNGLVSQNKEGLVSLVGYMAIHTFGLLMGTILLPPSPSSFHRMLSPSSPTTALRKKTDDDDDDSGSDADNHAPFSTATSTTGTVERQTGKAALELTSYSLLFWTALTAMSFLLSVSRKGVDSEEEVVVNVLTATDRGMGREVSRRMVRHFTQIFAHFSVCSFRSRHLLK